MRGLKSAGLTASVLAVAAAGAVIAAASTDVFAPAYGDAAVVFGAGAAQIHAANAFEAADLDRSGTLDSDEFASMRLVTAELAQLNGFIAVDTGGVAERVLLPISAPSSLSAGERARVTALAYREFYAEAGPDAKLSRREFLAVSGKVFARFDRDRDGVLQRHELTRYASDTAFLSAGV